MKLVFKGEHYDRPNEVFEFVAGQQAAKNKEPEIVCKSRGEHFRRGYVAQKGLEQNREFWK